MSNSTLRQPKNQKLVQSDSLFLRLNRRPFLLAMGIVQLAAPGGNVDAAPQPHGGRNTGSLQAISKGVHPFIRRAAPGRVGSGVKRNEIDVAQQSLH